mgnify:CR=1 FL=1
MGKPVICLDHCGFADVVNDTCGIKIPIGTPSNVIAGFARRGIKPAETVPSVEIPDEEEEEDES